MKITRVLLWSLALISLILIASAQSEQDDKNKHPSPSATPLPTATPAPEKDDKYPTPTPTATPLPTATPAPSKDDKYPTPTPTATPLPTATPAPGKDDKYPTPTPTATPLPTATPKPECCKCKETPLPTATPTPTPTPMPAAPCKLVCQDGYIVVKIQVPNVHVEGALADYLGFNGKAGSAKLSIMFKPDFVEREESEKPKEFWLSEKGAYCMEVSKENVLKFSRKGAIADGVSIRATLNPTKDRLTIEIVDDEHRISVILKKGNTGFGALEHMLDGSLPQGVSSVDLIADLDAHHEQKNKEMDLSALKIVSRVDVNKCNAKAAPVLCAPCTGQDCGDIKKCQVTLTDTKEPTANKTALIKLDARWRSCFNRTNTRKSNDFWISLINIKECSSKDQSNCQRQIVDFSSMTVSGGSPQGIPSRESPVVTLEGKLPILGSSERAYVKLVVSLINDRLSIRIQLNKGDKFQWIPSGKYNVMIFNIKIFGQQALAMLPKNNAKTDHKLVEFEITDNVRLPIPGKSAYFQDFVVKTRLSLEFPIKAPNGQVLKVKKEAIQDGKATMVSLEFASWHFSNGIFDYGPINGKLSWRQLSKAQAAAEEANASGSSDSSDSQADMFDNQRQGDSSAACSLNSWFF